MLTQFLKSINWIDVALAVLFVRIVFTSVRTGFITEFFKSLGVLSAFLVSLHYFTFLALKCAPKTSLALDSWKFLIFVIIISAVYVAFKFIRDGILLLFKMETTHQGFDKYAAGFLGVFRAVFVCSLIIFALMLLRHEYIRTQTLKSWSYRITANAAPCAYRFLYKHVIGKLFEAAKLNEDVFAVVAGNGSHPK